ncbi:hypothetical protein J437_LFUL011200, partial [Ladona fulva]
MHIYSYVPICLKRSTYFTCSHFLMVCILLGGQSNSDEDFRLEGEEVAGEDGKKKHKKKKKKRKKKRGKKGNNPWESSDSSSSEEGEEEEEEEEDDDEVLVFKSDHEFSPESDLEQGPEEDVQPTRRARTAR